VQLIGITAAASGGGSARVGKDTAAELLEKDGFIRLAFADPLYAAVQVLLGLTDAEMQQYVEHKDFQLPRWGKSLREVLQDLGDWSQRTFGERVFVETLSSNMDRHLGACYAGTIKPALGYVVPDVRLEHEAAWIREQGGLMIHLAGPRRSDAPASGKDHKTEQGVAFVSGSDVLINNDGTVSELALKLKGVLMAAREVA
jgi:hypothetical protein